MALAARDLVAWRPRGDDRLWHDRNRCWSGTVIARRRRRPPSTGPNLEAWPHSRAWEVFLPGSAPWIPLPEYHCPKGQRERWCSGGQPTQSAIGSSPRRLPRRSAMAGFSAASSAGVLRVGSIQLTGCKDELIRSGGENFASKEVEDLLTSYPGVKPGIPDRAAGREMGRGRLHVDRPGTQGTVTAAELMDFCRQNLAGFGAPDIFFFIDVRDLPRRLPARCRSSC